MLCTRCLRRLLLARGPLSRPSAPGRNFTNTHSIRSEPSLDPPAPAPSTTPVFSTPFTDSSSPPTPSDVKRPEPKSRVTAGTVLKGLGYLKSKESPMAGEDDEYPDWLWGLLDKDQGGTGKNSEKGAEGDFFSKSKKQRRIAANAARKAALDPSPRIPVVPYEHQTIDLPVAESQDGGVKLNAAGGESGWVEAQKAREKLTKAMRVQRRKAIKESNFLKSMK